MSKYFIVSMISIILLLLPYAFDFFGLGSMNKLNTESLRDKDIPSVLFIPSVVLSWFGFYFSILTFQIAGAGIILTLFTYCMLIIWIGAIISILIDIIPG